VISCTHTLILNTVQAASRGRRRIAKQQFISRRLLLVGITILPCSLDAMMRTSTYENSLIELRRKIDDDPENISREL